jgi:hypothetical protein
MLEAVPEDVRERFLDGAMTLASLPFTSAVQAAALPADAPSECAPLPRPKKDVEAMTPTDIALAAEEELDPESVSSALRRTVALQSSKRQEASHEGRSKQSRKVPLKSQ